MVTMMVLKMDLLPGRFVICLRYKNAHSLKTQVFFRASDEEFTKHTVHKQKWKFQTN